MRILNRESGVRRWTEAVLLNAGLACAVLVGGCAHSPRHAPAPATVPPAAPVASRTLSDGIPTTSVDLSRTAGDGTTFHEKATERQKFQVHIDFGKIFDSRGELDRAVQEYQDALKVAEARGHRELTAADQALAHRRIASALDRLGRFPQAEEHYQRARKLAPRDARVWNDSGYSSYLQGRWADAERALRTAMKLAPEDARVRMNLGMALAAAGKTAEALPLLSGNQGDAIGHANLGYLLAATGQYDRARHEYQAALAMRPDLPVARRALAQLDRQERGITTPPQTLVARNTGPAPAPVDPQVAPASARADDEILPPPMPPLPPLPPVAIPKLPSRSLPAH